MEYAAILFIILGVLVILVGIYVYRGNGDIFPSRYSVPNNTAYLKYLGNKIIIAGFVIALLSVALVFFGLE